MGKQPIGFRGNKALVNLINIMAAKMGKGKSEFIEYCVLMVTKAHDESLYNEYQNGDIKLIGNDDE